MLELSSAGSSEGEADDFVVGIRTWGSHPNFFVFDPVALWRLFGHGNWDLLDFHEEPFSLAMAELLAVRYLRGRRIPFVFYTAQNILKRYPLPFRIVEQIALAKAAGSYPCSIGAAGVLQSKRVRVSPDVVPLGVELQRFEPASRGAPTKPLKVGYVGRLEPHKGVDDLISAVGADTDLELHIYGDGSDAGRLAKMPASLRYASRVIFHGFIDPAAVADVYRSLDVLAVPSLATASWTEQFCRVAIEAMACGVPVVATRTGALPEVVGPAGILVEQRDPDALHEALRSLLDDGLWLDLRNRSIDHARKFTWGSVAEAQLALYEKALVG